MRRLGGSARQVTQKRSPLIEGDKQSRPVGVHGVPYGDYVMQVGGDFNAVLAGGGAVGALAPDGVG